MKRRRRRARLVVGAAALLLLAAAAIAGDRARRALTAPHAFGAPGEERTLEIPPGEPTRAILARLEAAGVLRSALLTRLYCSRLLGDPPLRAGEYRFVSPVAAVEVVAKLRAGDVITHPVTIVEGSTYHETAEALARAGFGASAEYVREFESAARVADLDPAAETLEGYLFPDTYRFPRRVAAAAVVDALVERFRRVWSDDVARLRAPGDERPLRELVILASLVEKETGRDDERPLVAAVYANRLRRGIGLFADPTLIYGLKLAGRWDGDLRRRDLEADSPWNTYRRPGLPPGPICSPGRASLAAALRPAAVDFLYFVSRNDGSHVFSSTLVEHNRAVDTWQRRYFRERRDAARGRQPPRD
jgi:UPF0755 protein